MSIRAHARSLTLAVTVALVAPFALVAAVAADTVTATPAASSVSARSCAHGRGKQAQSIDMIDT